MLLSPTPIPTHIDNNIIIKQNFQNKHNTHKKKKHKSKNIVVTAATTIAIVNPNGGPSDVGD
jgi:hypothetical protein